MTRLAAVPNDANHPAPDDANHHPAPPKLRLVPPPRLTQRELVVLALIRCPDAPSKRDRS
jgi:hypothetical protein